MNNTKDKNLIISDTTWFTEENINFVEEKIESNLDSLFNCEKYANLSDNFSKIHLELLSTLNEKQRTLFYNYENSALSLNSYQNTLAYYLGLNEK